MTRRLVFLGDSITDGHTLVLHVEQALAAAGEDVHCCNAGIGGDRADQMLARLARDVLPLRPDTVLVSAGINDAMQNIDPATYRAALEGIISAVMAAGAAVIVLTPTALAARYPEARRLTQAYAAIQRELACRHGLRLADVAAAMAGAQAAGSRALLASDGIHLEEPGYCAMAAAVLATLGHPHAAIPERPRWAPVPGLVTRWRISGAGGAALDWSVPEAAPCAAWWDDQERARGFARGFAERLPGPTWTAETDLPAGPAIDLAAGGQCLAIALDGRTIAPAAPFADGYRGWHVRPICRLPASTSVRTLRLQVGGPFAVTCVAAE